MILGLFVLTGLGLGILGLFFIGNRNGLDGSAFRLRAGFANIGGVEVGTRVRLQGMDAGEVEAITLPVNVGDKVVLHLRVAGRMHHLVNSETRVEIAAENVFNGKIVHILPGSPQGKPVEDDALLASVAPLDMMDSLAQATEKLNQVLAAVDSTLIEFRSGEGTLGKLARNNDVYVETLSSLQDVRKMVNSVKQNSDAIKSLPLVRDYVVDPIKELIRPECKRYRKWFAEDQLFEPGKAFLTGEGKKRLDEVSSWLNEDKKATQDVVIAAFANPTLNPDFAQTLTQKQSDAVMEYLKNNYRVHRTGFWYWSNRSVRSIGVGTYQPPVPESENLPPARIELLIFVPQG